MTNILDQMEKDAEEKEIKSDDLKSISALAKDLNDLEAQIEEQQDVLNDLKNKYRQISEEDLPSKLEEVGMAEFKLSDGTSISVSRFYSGRITEENRDQCFHWLEENGLGDIIKNTVSANFGRGEDESAKTLMNSLEKEGYSLMQKKWVEPMTLKAVIKEQVEKGSDLPLDTFNVYVGRKIKVKK